MCIRDRYYIFVMLVGEDMRCSQGVKYSSKNTLFLFRRSNKVIWKLLTDNIPYVAKLVFPYVVLNPRVLNKKYPRALSSVLCNKSAEKCYKCWTQKHMFLGLAYHDFVKLLVNNNAFCSRICREFLCEKIDVYNVSEQQTKVWEIRFLNSQ